jgi:hypothetical protein
MISHEDFEKRLDTLDARSHYGLVTLQDVHAVFAGAQFADKDVPDFWKAIVSRGISLVEEPEEPAPSSARALRIHSDIERQGQITELRLNGRTAGKDIETLLNAKRLRAFPAAGRGLSLLLWTDTGRDPQEPPLALPVMILSRPFIQKPSIFFRDVIITKADKAGTVLDFTDEDRTALIGFVNDSIAKLNHLHESLREDR